MARFFAVRNFDKFQHYKDRNPPWIKLYGEILEKYEFGSLPDASKAHLLLIWLLASRLQNRIPWDPIWVASKIGARDPPGRRSVRRRAPSESHASRCAGMDARLHSLPGKPLRALRGCQDQIAQPVRDHST